MEKKDQNAETEKTENLPDEEIARRKKAAAYVAKVIEIRAQKPAIGEFIDFVFLRTDGYYRRDRIHRAQHSLESFVERTLEDMPELGNRPNAERPGAIPKGLPMVLLFFCSPAEAERAKHFLVRDEVDRACFFVTSCDKKTIAFDPEVMTALVDLANREPPVGQLTTLNGPAPTTKMTAKDMAAAVWNSDAFQTKSEQVAEPPEDMVAWFQKTLDRVPPEEFSLIASNVFDNQQPS